MNAIQFLLDYYNAPEYEDVKDEMTERWDSLAECMEEYHQAKLKLLNSSEAKNREQQLTRITITSKSGKYRCLLCGRDKFTKKSPHKCIDGYRKHNLIFEEINPAKTS
jgi:rubrerythrin